MNKNLLSRKDFTNDHAFYVYRDMLNNVKLSAMEKEFDQKYKTGERKRRDKKIQTFVRVVGALYMLLGLAGLLTIILKMFGV